MSSVSETPIARGIGLQLQVSRSEMNRAVFLRNRKSPDCRSQTTLEDSPAARTSQIAQRLLDHKC